MQILANQVDSEAGGKAGAYGGAILSIVYSITMAEIEKTIVLALIGTIVSFSVAAFMKKLVKHFKN